MGLWRRQRWRSLDEAAAYSRCHGDRSPELLSVRRVPPSPPVALVGRGRGRVTGEQLRRRFEQLLDDRRDER
jgi:hypothetical protein